MFNLFKRYSCSSTFNSPELHMFSFLGERVWRKENLRTYLIRSTCACLEEPDVFLTCKKNRTQRGPLALNFIRVGILASGWLFQVQVNAAVNFSWAQGLSYICSIPKCPVVFSSRVLERRPDERVFPKQNQHFHALVSCISMVNGCLLHSYLLKQQYTRFSTFSNKRNRK